MTNACSRYPIADKGRPALRRTDRSRSFRLEESTTPSLSPKFEPPR